MSIRFYLENRKIHFVSSISLSFDEVHCSSIVHLNPMKPMKHETSLSGACSDLELKFLQKDHLPQPVMCHVSQVWYHESCIMSFVSYVIFQMPSRTNGGAC